jgi:hypothetical protein
LPESVTNILAALGRVNAIFQIRAITAALGVDSSEQNANDRPADAA